jgi:hypothetical protein
MLSLGGGHRGRDYDFGCASRCLGCNPKVWVMLGCWSLVWDLRFWRVEGFGFAARLGVNGCVRVVLGSALSNRFVLM